MLFIAYGNHSAEGWEGVCGPHYFFIVNMFVLLGVGTAHGRRHAQGPPQGVDTMIRSDPPRKRFLDGSTVSRADSVVSGGAAVTVVEAISNGYRISSAAWKNAPDACHMGSLLA